MKGIILAGGAGTRLYPLTELVCKQLLPVSDKPMIHYPLSVLMLAGIQDILIISTPKDLPLFTQFLGDGSKLGIQLRHVSQPEPKGIADALLIGEPFVGHDDVCLILGDNIFYGAKFISRLPKAHEKQTKATIFAYQVHDPERYGVVEFDKDGRAFSLEEKPDNPKSSYAVPGLYFYDNRAIQIARDLEVSKRGELEITDVNRQYMKTGDLHVTELGRGTAWLDMGTHTSLLEASNFVAAIEARQGLKIGCVEEVAYRMGYLSKPALKQNIESMPESSYREYLERLIDEQQSTSGWTWPGD